VLPLHTLKKSEILWLANRRCKHGHNYLAHYNCYLKEENREEKIGFLDIEASNKDAEFGIILCYCIKPLGEDKILYDVINKKDLQGKEEDKRVVRNLIRDMLKFDRLCGFYSSRFDVPFIRTRALCCGLDFPSYGSLKHTDVYDLAKRKLKLHSNKQEVVARTILGKTEKTYIEPRYWRRALSGDKKSLDYILDHCKRDVRDLERIWLKLNSFGKIQNTSI
jgi:uncharacterized protein YprB with RNaseH-like and TPR domain